MYSSHGYKSIRYTPPWTYNFLNGDKIHKTAQDFFNFFTNQKEFHDNFVFVHVFSNLGCSMYNNFMIQLQDHSKNINIRGTVYIYQDSKSLATLYLCYLYLSEWPGHYSTVHVAQAIYSMLFLSWQSNHACVKQRLFPKICDWAKCHNRHSSKKI